MTPPPRPRRCSGNAANQQFSLADSAGGYVRPISRHSVTFTSLGPAYSLNNAWQFMGYRYGIFNYATTALHGAVTINRFEMTTP